ncbi:MAG: ShlB/FhaC/HecB family hemolysin secretion/activation protein [Cyanobacteria bacterium P01_F01_bin.56]
MLILPGISATVSHAQTPDDTPDVPEDLPQLLEEIVPPDREPIPEPELPPEDLEGDPLAPPETPFPPEPTPLTTESVTIAEISITENTVFSDAALLQVPLITLHDCPDTFSELDSLALSLDVANPDGAGEVTSPPATPAADAAMAPEAATNPTCPPLASIQGQLLTAPQLFQVAEDVAGFYQRQGYRTSGAVIDVSGEPDAATLEIVLVEDRLEDISINNSLLADYVRNRLGVAIDEPLNLDQLQENLRLLQLDPFTETISASLTTGSRVGRSFLTVEVDDAPHFRTPIRIDNANSPSVGSFQQEVTIAKDHTFTVGDNLSLGYSRSDGSDGFDVSYGAILNPNNDTLNFSYSYANNVIIEEPFDRLDIRSNSQTYDLVYRRPVYRTIRGIRPEEIAAARNAEDSGTPRLLPTYEEFALTFGGSLRDSRSTLSGIPFGFSDVAGETGRTRTVVLQLGQEWTRQNALQVLSLRSQFNLGTSLFGASVQPDDFPIDIPDSQFFSWQGQGQWVRLVEPRNPNFYVAIRGSAQFASEPLLPTYKFSLGGFGSIRGYRKDNLLTDNGLLINTEIYVPLVQNQYGSVLQLVPFVDVGLGWNRDSDNAPLQTSNFRSSLGLGLQFTRGAFRARLDVGFPTVDIQSRGETWQEEGIYFSVQYVPRF